MSGRQHLGGRTRRAGRWALRPHIQGLTGSAELRPPLRVPSPVCLARRPGRRSFRRPGDACRVRGRRGPRCPFLWREAAISTSCRPLDSLPHVWDWATILELKASGRVLERAPLDPKNLTSKVRCLAGNWSRTSAGVSAPLPPLPSRQTQLPSSRSYPSQRRTQAARSRPSTEACTRPCLPNDGRHNSGGSVARPPSAASTRRRTRQGPTTR